MQETLNNIRSRPRFRLRTTISQEEYKQSLKSFLNENKNEFLGIISQDVSVIRVRTKENPYWKPRLTLVTEKSSDNGETIIRGIFGPSQPVWTFFVFLYFLFSMGFFVLLIMWYIKKTVGSNEMPWLLQLSLVCLVMVGVTYAAARYGQHKSAEEIKKLREFAERSTLQYEKAE